jgi:para-nitrobenzyl esterase
MNVFGRRNVTALLAAAAAAALAAVAVLGFTTQSRAQTAQSPPACTSGTDVQTNSGPVCGVTASDQMSYLDIPFAAPPVGSLRWEPPQAPQPWTTTYQATQSVPECLSPAFGAPGVQAGTSEDCLYLEVIKPADVQPGQKLPVMVEFHGGGFIGTALTNNGGNLVSTGPVIYVFPNYRLGILGFLADKGFGPNAGDYGLMDQQFALRWVQQNIAAFGGNPDNVTIFGESAGGATECDQVTSPAAKGLFKQAISISGFYNYNVNTVWWPADCKENLLTEAQAQAMSAQFAAKVGCGSAAAVAACLRAVPADTLAEDGGQVENVFGGGVIGPIVNGTTLPMSPGKAFKTGHVNHVKLMIGVGGNEFNGGVYANTPGQAPVVATTPAQYQQLVTQQFGSLAPKVMQLYPLQDFPSPFIAYRNIMADAFSACPALANDAQLSKYIPVYAYEDDDTDSPATGTTEPLGAYHSAINRLVHDSPSSLDPNQAALQTQVLLQWTSFARTGNPDVAGAPPWTSYTAANPMVMSWQPSGDSMLTPASTLMTQHNCGFWDAVNQRAPWAAG